MIEIELADIRKSFHYRGQIYKLGREVPGRPPLDCETGKEGPSGFIGEVLKEKKFPCLFEHQIKTLKSGEAKKHTLLCTPVGSGRSTICNLLGFETVLAGLKNALFLFPKQEFGLQWLKKLRSFTEGAEWFYGLEYGSLLSQEDVDHFPLESGIPQFLFTTPQFLETELIRKREKWRPFLQDLGVVFVEDAEFYTGVYGVHCAFLLRRFQQILAREGCEPTCVASMIPYKGFEAFAKTLLNVEIQAEQVIAEDARGWESKHFVFWNPPLDVSLEDLNRIIRVSVSVDFRNFLRVLGEVRKDDEGVLVLNKNLHLNEMDLIRLATETGDSRLQLGRNIFFARDVSEVSDETFDLERIRTVVILGYPGSLRSMLWEIIHLGINPVSVYVYNCQDPLSIFYLRNCDKLLLPEESAVESIFLDLSNQEILKTHLIAALRDKPMTEKEVTTVFGVGGLTCLLEMTRLPLRRRPPVWEKVSCRQRLFRKGEKIREFFISDEESNVFPQVSLMTASPALCQVIENGTIVGNLSREQAAQSGLNGMVISLENRRYRVTELVSDKDGPNKLVVVREEAIVRTERSGEIQVKCASSMDKKSLEHLALTMHFGPVTIEETITGFREFSRFECVSEGERHVQVDAGVKTSFQTKSVFFHFETEKEQSKSIHHSLKHLFKIFLPSIVKICPDEIEMRLVDLKETGGWTIVAYDNEVGGTGIARFLYENLSEIETLLTRSYRLLADCPCTEGCSACLKIAGCREADYNKGLDKKRALTFLGTILNMTDLTIQLKKKYEKLVGDKPEDFEILKNIAAEVVRILKDKLGVEIQNPVSAIFMDKVLSAQCGAAGFWDPERNIIAMQPGFPESWYMDILSHEYFHDWQGKSGKFSAVLKYYSHEYIDDPKNILFRGKFLIEGSANWAEFRAIDFFNLGEEMANLNHRHFDQYGEGFHFIRYIEATSGFNEVFKFLETALIAGKEFHQICSRLLTDSGVEGRLHLSRNKAVENGGLLCLRQLKRDYDLVSISHFFDITKDKPIQFPPPDAQSLSKEILQTILRKASVKDVVEAKSEAEGIFLKHGLSCTSCTGKAVETVESAAFMHSRGGSEPSAGVSATKLCEALVNDLSDLFLQGCTATTES